MSVPDRRALVDRDQREPSIRRQCELLGIGRSGVYRRQQPANDNDAGLMRRIDDNLYLRRYTTAAALRTWK